MFLSIAVENDDFKIMGGWDLQNRCLLATDAKIALYLCGNSSAFNLMYGNSVATISGMEKKLKMLLFLR